MIMIEQYMWLKKMKSEKPTGGGPVGFTISHQTSITHPIPRRTIQ